MANGSIALVAALCSFLMLAMPVFAIPTDGLVGYYTFDSISGNTVADSSGNGNSGTISGPVSVINSSFNCSYNAQQNALCTGAQTASATLPNYNDCPAYCSVRGASCFVQTGSFSPKIGRAHV